MRKVRARSRIIRRPLIPTLPKSRPDVKTFLMSVRTYNQLETDAPRVVNVFHVPKKGWFLEVEDRRIRGEQRQQQLGVKLKGRIHMTAAEYFSLRNPLPIGFRQGLHEIDFDERRGAKRSGFKLTRTRKVDRKKK